MPTKPKRPCSWRGCYEFASSNHRYCTNHRKQSNREYNARRPNEWQSLYNRKWRKARTHYLRQNPLCVECKRYDRLIPATEVDHIEPHKGDLEKFWNVDNYAALCKSCHSKKTRREPNDNK